METIVRLNKWANSHTNVLTDILRIGLGVFLFSKGLMFLDQTDYLMSIIPVVDHDMTRMFIGHYIAPVHMVGGLFIALGFMTRISVLLQLPILIGAVLVGFSIGEQGAELPLALLTLGVCIAFLFLVLVNTL